MWDLHFPLVCTQYHLLEHNMTTLLCTGNGEDREVGFSRVHRVPASIPEHNMWKISYRCIVTCK